MQSITSLPDDILVKIMWKIIGMNSRYKRIRNFLKFASTCKKLARLAAERITIPPGFVYQPNLTLYVGSSLKGFGSSFGHCSSCSIDIATRKLCSEYKNYIRVKFMNEALTRHSLNDIDLSPIKIRSLACLHVEDCLLDHRWLDEALTKFQGIKLLILDEVNFRDPYVNYKSRRPISKLCLILGQEFCMNYVKFLAYLCPAESLSIRLLSCGRYPEPIRRQAMSAIMFYLRKNRATLKSLTLEGMHLDCLKEIVSDKNLNHLELIVRSNYFSPSDKSRFSGRVVLQNLRGHEYE